MKKTIIIILLIAVSITISGCIKKKDAADKTAKPSEPQGGMLIGETDNSLLGWLKRGKGVECVVEDIEGRIVVQSKQDKVRMTGIPYVNIADAIETGAEPDPSGVSLSVDGWAYIWSERDKKGTKMNLSKLEALAEENEDMEKQKSWDETVAEWEEEEAKYNCDDKNLSDNIFDVPKDVEFTDFTEMLLGIAEMGKEMEKQFDAGGEMDLEALEQQAKELQEKYGIEE